MVNIKFSVLSHIGNFMRRLKKPDNIIYVILVFLSIALVTSEYSFDVALKTVVVLFCLIFTVRNVFIIYIVLKNYVRAKQLTINSVEIIELVITTAVVIGLCMFYLSSYLASYIFVLAGCMLLFLLFFDVIFNRRK